MLRELRRDSEGVLELHYDTPKGARRLRTRSMSLTIPAHAAADLLRSASPETCEALRSIDYPPVAAVAVSYPLSAIREDRKDAAGKLPGGLQSGLRMMLTLFFTSIMAVSAHSRLELGESSVKAAQSQHCLLILRCL